MWIKALKWLLPQLVQHGQLAVIFPDGSTQTFGTGEPEIAIEIKDEATCRRLFLDPQLALGEAYMDETLTIEGDDLRGFLDLILHNLSQIHLPVTLKPLEVFRRVNRYVKQFNPVGRSQVNVAHHYDLSAGLYDLFLDEDRQYSCAYFEHPDMALEDAQQAKKHHIARKLLIEPGMHVLDIGCGWGGMALTLAGEYDARVTGVTLSTEQHSLATRRVAEAGLSDRIDIKLIDYRQVRGPFDRIVSVGMFEHVGVPHYREYFRKVRDLLTPDGVALIHTIGRTSPPGATSPWIDKYIFPGGYCPALSETMAAVETTGLETSDIEVWRLHYAETLKEWHRRFVENEDKAQALYDARFCRMWRFYLLSSELTFRHNSQVVFQLQLARKIDTVPVTRSYLHRDRTTRPLSPARKRGVAAE